MRKGRRLQGSGFGVMLKRKILQSEKSTLSPDQPHDPSGDKYSADKHRKAVEKVVQLLFGCVLLRDAKYGRGEQRKHDRGGEVGQGDGHGFFPKAM
jgi:hypothetical protein